MTKVYDPDSHSMIALNLILIFISKSIYSSHIRAQHSANSEDSLWGACFANVCLFVFFNLFPLNVHLTAVHHTVLVGTSGEEGGYVGCVFHL